MPFTADDVVATVQTQIAHPGMLWGAQFTVTVAEVTATDPHTVVFKLKQANSRFHSIFTVRWQGAWILPKHIFEKVEDPLKFNFTNFVTLGAYTDPELSIRTATGSSGRGAPIGSAPPWAASANPGLATSSMSPRARPMSG